MNFSKQHESFSVKKILTFLKAGKLNLNPGFQRDSVWTTKERKLLIDTILRGMPLQSLFLWEHKDGNKVIYDVIDGKQRIESLVEFTKNKSALVVPFSPEKYTLWSNQDVSEWSWKSIQAEETAVAKQFLAYDIPVVIVRGSLPDIEQVFIRINSTGKQLTPQEIRHSQWYKNSDLLVEAERIAKTKKYANYFMDMHILSPGQITRMKAIELISEFMLSIEKEDVLDRKKALDSVMSNKAINKNTIGRLGREVMSVLDIVRKSFPELPTSRFSKASDFYALFFVVWKMKRDGYVLKDQTLANWGFQLLNELGLELSKYRESSRRGERRSLRSPAREYHSTILEGTDTARHRLTRVHIIESILRPIFPQKDSQRLFSLEQKQLLWHTSKDKFCANSSCKKKKPLTWKDVRMDHITAHSKGGMADLKNAQILCATCNSEKDR